MEIKLKNLDGSITTITPKEGGKLYTNKKDRNNVEIYDGDIVLDDNEKKDTIYYNKSFGAFCFSGEPYIGIGSKEVEVIGNIHKNPELL